MTPDEKHIRIASDLYKMRDKAKILLGDRYKPHMDDLGKIITESALRAQKSPLEFVIAHCKKKDLQGMELIFTLAAAVELAEPSA